MKNYIALFLGLTFVGAYGMHEIDEETPVFANIPYYTSRQNFRNDHVGGLITVILNSNTTKQKILNTLRHICGNGRLYTKDGGDLLERWGNNRPIVQRFESLENAKIILEENTAFIQE